jgi:Na+/H+ antiporter NhaD/arsenite permease-like protein
MDYSLIALTVFILAYVLFIIFSTRRTLIAVVGSLFLVVCGVLTPHQAFLAVNWNVMGIFVGTLAVADIFMKSRVPAFLAERIVAGCRTTAGALLAVCAMTSFISAFVENVATVLIVAPLALAMAKKMKISPVPIMIAIAVSSNLQGTATLIGDPPSMLLGGFAKMTFFDFFFYHGRPGIFFAVQFGALASFFILKSVFRGMPEKQSFELVEKVESWGPTFILVSLIVLLAVTSFFDTGFSYMAGILCMVFGFLSLIWEKFVFKGKIRAQLKGLDWDTTFFLMGVFVLVGAVTQTGWIDRAAEFLAGMVGTNLFLGYTVLVFLSMILSAFIDNVPFLAAMLPVAMSMAAKLGIDPSLFLFGLLIGASLGGNITPIGASANIVACGLLKKEGYTVGFKEFGRIGVPFTLVAVAAAYIFIWVIWSR